MSAAFDADFETAAQEARTQIATLREEIDKLLDRRFAAPSSTNNAAKLEKLPDPDKFSSDQSKLPAFIADGNHRLNSDIYAA
jgi:hypothetical protein